MTSAPDDLTALLSKHVPRISQDGYMTGCTCGWALLTRGETHRAHVALELAAYVRAAQAEALREAADEQERLATGPRALGSKAVQFKRMIFATWLRERASRIEQGGGEG